MTETIETTETAATDPMAAMTVRVAQAIELPLPEKLLTRESLLAFKRAINERVAALLDEIDDVIVPELQAAGGCVMGEVRYYAGPDKDHKNRDLLTTVEAVFQASSGDWQAFVDCLSTNAFKAGATRKLFEASGEPARFEACFETVEKWVVKEGKPTRGKVQSFNPQFVR